MQHTSPRIHPLSLENPYKWKIFLQHSACIIPLHVSLPVSLENPYKWKISLQHSARIIPLHISLPCLFGESIQMENFLTT